MAFDVVPAKAHQIVLSPLDAARPKKRKKRPKTAEANQVQSSVSNADPHRELCPDLSVCIVDEFGNLTTSADFMEVHLRLQYDGDEDAGDVSVDMIEGVSCFPAASRREAGWGGGGGQPIHRAVFGLGFRGALK